MLSRPSSILLSVLLISTIDAQSPQGYFNGSAFVILRNTLSPQERISFSFRTCSSGQLLYQEGKNGNFFSVSLQPQGHLEIKWKTELQNKLHFGTNLSDNRWHYVDFIYKLGVLLLDVDSNTIVIANSTYNNEIFRINLEDETPALYVGRNFSGCILQGANVILSNSSLHSSSVVWNNCPMLEGNCNNLCRLSTINRCQNGATCVEDKPINSTKCICQPKFVGQYCETFINLRFCDDNPCLNGGSCTINQLQDGYTCICNAGYTGNNCELYTDHCQNKPCKNNGTCIDEGNSYICDCAGTGYRGANCEVNINECEELHPCMSGGTCFDRYGGYMCHCRAGYGGKNCEDDINECMSSPCKNGGICIDLQDRYECNCLGGFTGINCELSIGSCVNAACHGNSTCITRMNRDECVCSLGFTGTYPNCSEINECDSNPCLNGGTCLDKVNRFQCSCQQGFGGHHCEQNSSTCYPNPCQNGGRCVAESHSYTCECASGYSGNNCELSRTECSSNPCVQAIGCQDLVSDYLCDCLPGWEGKNCDQNIDDCLSQPCLHGNCIDHPNNYSCFCQPGYSGYNCDVNVDDCESQPCQNGGTCEDLVTDFSCRCTPGFSGKVCSEEFGALMVSPRGNERCPEGFSGINCSIEVDPCLSNPCINGTCTGQPGEGYSCSCLEGITGINCDEDINECTSNPCTYGICKNTHGSYLCYCRPGYTGHKCHIDFDECLSSPCQNNGTCWNEISNYRCACVPGFSGKNCETNIDECESQPCINGGTCQDRINSYMCRCIPGYAGINCEINIDECESSPCLNGGHCIDLINEYFCNCSDTGFTGKFCDINIDDCEGNPCQHGSSCTDLIKDYNCDCFDGFSGKNCEIDFPDCASNPCQNNASCLEKSNQTLYDLGLFNSFSYSEASGYTCICLPGFTGGNCEENIDDCEANDCVNGTCIDEINSYFCQCFAGFEGRYCDQDINECLKFLPCQNGATCEDLIADYNCQCPPNFGGKNCSIQLLGCRNNYCENGATCVPYLTDDGHHQYSCICPPGFFGKHCTIVTTVSFGSYSVISAFGSHSGVTPTFWSLPSEVHHRSRLPQYELAFQFRTTLENGLLAQGTSAESGYLLYLRGGAVHLTFYRSYGSTKTFNLQSRVNDAQWKDLVLLIGQNIFTLNVSGEVKQESIIFNGTSFIETSFGRGLSTVNVSVISDVPNFVGCIREVKKDDQLIIPDINSPDLVGAKIGCNRTEQCYDSTCYNSGTCIDNWDTHTCICARSFFGEQCQYSYSPATFGAHGTVGWSEVNIGEEDRKTIENFVNIGLVFRTRKEKGLLFDLSEHRIESGQYTEAPSLKAFVQGSHVHVILHLRNNPEIIVTFNKKIDDGRYHFLNISCNYTSLQVALNDSKKSLNVSSDERLSPVSPVVLYIGHYPNVSITKRETFYSNEVTASSGRTGAIYESSQPLFGNFKGIIKDMEVNNKIVAFFPLGVPNASDLHPVLNATNNEFVEKGIVSDQPCKNSPCQNNAMCTDTWNDYRCNCSEDYRGKNCSELQPCAQNHDCPLKSRCHNLDDGYECVATAAFNGRSKIQLLSQISTNVTNITFLYRTLDHGAILSMQNFDGTFTIAVGKSLHLIWNDYNESASSPGINMADGEWHSVKLIFSGENITAWSNNTMLSSIQNTVFNSMLDNNTRIIVAHSSDSNYKDFQGCIEEVRVNGILLPFTPNGSISNFNLEINTSIMGCILCWDEECNFNKNCRDKENSFNCNCGNRYTGRYCDTDRCITEKPCKHNRTCTFNETDIECDCGADYEGKFCEVTVKHCLANPCQHNGTCTDLDPGFKCVCTEDYEGRLCEISKIKDCQSNPCKNNATCIDKELDFNYTKFYCLCRRGYTGVTCENQINFCQSNPCKNGANCSSILSEATFRCHCVAGYTGETCAKQINECLSEPCKHGRCHPSFRNYTCVCNHGYMGRNCDKQVTLCSQKPDICNSGNCTDEGDSYSCLCEVGFFGKHCSLRDPCYPEIPCNKNEICFRDGDEDQNITTYTCSAPSSSGPDNIGFIVGLIVGCIFFLCIFIAIIMFLRVAKKKRATRGTYSPSRQEMYGSRVEMNHVMKPPPEERLI